MNIGVLYSVQDNPNESLTHYSLALDTLLELGENTAEVASLYNLMGLAQTSATQYEEALSSFERSLDIRLRIKVQPKEVGRTYYNLGCLHAAMGEGEKAVTEFENAYEIFERLFGSEDSMCQVCAAKIEVCMKPIPEEYVIED